VIVVFLSDRPQDGQLVGLPGDEREVFADVDTGHIGADRQEFSPTGFRAVGFEVPGVLVRWPTPHEQQDDPLGPAKRAGSQLVTTGGLPQDIGQPEAQRSQGPNLQGGAPRKTIAEPHCGAGMIQAEHQSQAGEFRRRGGAPLARWRVLQYISKTADL